jgi:hypothetical protein
MKTLLSWQNDDMVLDSYNDDNEHISTLIIINPIVNVDTTQFPQIVNLEVIATKPNKQ